MTPVEQFSTRSATAGLNLDEGLVTVVVPARDEADAIGDCLEALRAQDEPRLQIIVVDGGSTDDTALIVRQHAAADPRVELIANPARIIPAGLNLALAAARGAYFVRVDAHATVPPDYVRRAVSHLRSGRWGGVGGRKDAIGRTPAGRAIAVAMASPFGVGNSTYHHGTEVQVVDHVPFGAYPTALARELGGWDEELRVNQDFEFDYRVRSAGQELLFDPALRIDWECRQSLRDLARQYHRYGRGKARVLALHPRSAAPRHLAPPGLVVLLLLAAVVALRRPGVALGMVSPYVGVVAAAVTTTAASVPSGSRRYLPGAFLVMHFAWGAGLWRELTRLLVSSGRVPPR